MSVTKTRNYRITTILDTRGSEEPVEQLIEKLTTSLEELGGNVTETKNLGHHDFIRVTDKDHQGDVYLLMDCTGEPGLPEALHNKVRLDRTVKRVLVETI